MAKRKNKAKRTHGPTMADTADRHILYQKAVQAPEFEVEFFEDRYKELRNRKPMSLREDFCGTALLAVEWCKSDPRRTAIGVDLCADTLAWGQQHNVAPAGPKVARRVNLIQADVADVIEPKVDVACAMNFSFCVFKTREQLRHYFETVHAGLKRGGVFFLDLLGGTATIDVVDEDHEIEEEGATYYWEQEKFNPIDHHLLCHIHFGFDDGSFMKKAFTYDWRLWTLPELHELLAEAGFRKVHVFWEEFEDDGDDDNDYLVGTGNYIKVTERPNQESWIAYIVAER